MSDPSSIPPPTAASLPIDNFRNCSVYPQLGLCKLEVGASDEALVRRWLDLIVHAAAGVEKQSSDSEAVQLGNIQGTDLSWRRVSTPGIFPFYIEAIKVVSAVEPTPELSLPISRLFPGVFLVAASVFDASHDDFFEKHREEWSEWARGHAGAPSYVGGLSVNLLEVPAAALRDRSLDVRPLTLHAIAPDGRAVDRGDADAQAAIANAFWQTFWATGATRAERGSVFPVAFLPIDRGSSYEFAEPFHERYVSLRRRYFGRSAILGHVIEVLTKARALMFCPDDLKFKITPDFSPAAEEVTSADVLLAVAELNRTAFIDAYTGENAKRFAAWAEAERQGAPGDAWPYHEASARGKIKAAGHGIEDPLQAIRSSGECAPRCVVIQRVVPYAGCAYLYQVMTHTDELVARGKIQGLDGELLAGTNSTFFLNFPEEYSALHSAMNEPVALLVESGQTRQIRTIRRAAFVLTESGKAFITTRAGNHLNSDVLRFEGESSSTNYFEKSDRSFRENKFGPLFFGAAVVGNSIVETFEDIATEVPPAGWLTGDSEAFGGRIDPANIARVQIRQPGQLQEEDIRHAFAIGPLLVDDGKIVPLGESREEFRSLDLGGAAAAYEETSQLSRTELPAALLDCPARGVPPTRFPYDWNITRAPRSAIGVTKDGKVVIAVVDGRADVGHSVGATLAELAVIMQGLGCVQAMNMDGGGSSVMFVNADEAKGAKIRESLRDGIVSLPSDLGGVERLIPVPLVVVKRKAE